MDYEEPPRGRVVFNKKTQRFALYADRCILKRKTVVNQIIKAMHLRASRTGVTTDGPEGHYRCYRCMDCSEDREEGSWD